MYGVPGQSFSIVSKMDEELKKGPTLFYESDGEQHRLIDWGIFHNASGQWENREGGARVKQGEKEEGGQNDGRQ